MPKAESKTPSDFYARVYKLVCRVPFGKVTTYGAIAKYLGTPSSSRMVGYALNCAKDSGIPCHRVVNRFGALSGKNHFHHPDHMQQLLEAEGVEFKPDGTVNLEKHFYDFTI